MKKTTPFILATLILFVSSCETILSGKKISEGKIVYNIEYLDDESDNPLISLLPKTMEIKFKNNNTVTNIEGFFGTFKLRFISDVETKTNYSILRIMDKKYIQTVAFGEEPAGYEMPDFTIEETNEKVEIAGYKCHVAIINSEGKEPIKLYYTYDIKIKNPNANNPFSEIDGVLMGFQVKLTGLNMKFEAKKVVEEIVDDSEFAVPDDYKEVTKEELEEILLSFQN